ncbi:hypothetical protein FDP41_001138 [Naegleria fowleri]|uniref:Uncharacterized protein n=1 Tax=Naegleria fowleri TaxID=5763 RepID=A0A6A5C398_NAEFO|nr:uncharacterized protein FDP41_001138 [Naegleria fowleri]KAF0979985.1 hypothetical protein FDP41_001138 [Naegleria fowleri]
MDNINDFIYSTLIDCNEKLKTNSLELVCACADAEVDAKKLQTSLRQVLGPNFVFVNDYVHNFKYQRNCLLNGRILGNISMSTLINTMSSHPELYDVLDKEEVTPSDIMAIDPCLTLTTPRVIEILKSLKNDDSTTLAKYLENIREIYDIINENDTDPILFHHHLRWWHPPFPPL